MAQLHAECDICTAFSGGMSFAKDVGIIHAGKAAKFLGKLGQKIARNVYSEAIEPSQAYSRSAVDLGAWTWVCLLLCT